jgi:hypothetical protein
MSTKWQKIDIPIPEGYTPSERRAIGEAIVEFIRKRVKDKNLDKRNHELPAYSKSYVESLNFKIAGKSKSDVNFTQSGDTLAALDVLETANGMVRIGWEQGSKENAIADGNIRGTYGHSHPVGPKRDILGLTKKDLSTILKEFPLDDQAKRDHLRSFGDAISSGLDLFGPQKNPSPVLPTLGGEDDGG